MRWFCVHPSLPAQAELRVRSAPDSSSPECARVAQGRAIAVCGPVFHAPNDDPGEPPTPWLQVAFFNAKSCETEGGFMMAALPDGTPLLIAWEKTSYQGCGEIKDDNAELFDGPQESAQKVGAMGTTEFPLCVLEESSSRVRIAHATLESAWVDKKQFQVVCSRFSHAGCSTFHSFFTLNEELPEEAQIAIREFPSKDAQAIDLLSRGEVVEVTFRGGNWLRIVTGSLDDSEQDEAWIMWRADALELLMEFPGRRSENCKKEVERVEETIADVNQGDDDNIAVETNAEALSDETTKELDVEALENEIHTSAKTINMNQNEERQPEAELSSQHRPPASPQDKYDEAVETASAVVVDEEKAVETVPSASWEDRPIRPVPAVPDELSDEAVGTASAVVVDEEVVVETVPSASWEDRPIRPAPAVPDELSDEAVGTASAVVVDEEVVVETVPSASWEDRPIRPAPAVPDELSDEAVGTASAVVVDEEVVVETVPSASWEDRPIRPAPAVPDELSDEAVGTASAVVVDEEVVVETVPSASWEDRPIRPAPAVPDELSDEAVGTASAVVVDEEVVVETVPSASWEDRPIRPVRSEVELPEDSNPLHEISSAVDAKLSSTDNHLEKLSAIVTVKLVESVPAIDGSEGSVGSFQAAISLTDDSFGRASAVFSDTSDSEVDVPMLGESAPSWEDDCLIQPLNDAAEYAVDLPMLGDGVKSTQASPSWDTRPIQPVKDLDDSFLLDKSPVLDAAGTSVDKQGLLNELEKALASPLKNDDSGEVATLVEPRERATEDSAAADPADGSSTNLSEPADTSEAVPDGAINETGNIVADDVSDIAGTAENEIESGDEDTLSGALYMKKFGVVKYYEHKQALVAPSDDLSKAVFEGDPDDSDLIFQAFVGDDPLDDDWFQDVSFRKEPEAASSGLMDKSANKTTYELIMSDAAPEEILESTLPEDDDEDYDLITSFTYPTPKRRVIAANRGRDTFIRRVSSAPGTSAVDAQGRGDNYASDSGRAIAAESSIARHTSPLRHRMSESALISPAVKKSVIPPKNLRPQQPVAAAAIPALETSRLTQRQSIASPSSIGKPPSLTRPRARTTATASPVVAKSHSTLAKPRAASISTRTTSDPSPPRPAKSMLQRRSMLPTPSQTKDLGTTATRKSITSSIPKPAQMSGLQAPRRSFGFRPSKS